MEIAPLNPKSTKNLIRLLVGIIILLSYLAGYYHLALKTEQEKTNKLKSECNIATKEVRADKKIDL